MSVASRKMTAYAKTDCIGASKGLFFGLLTLVLGLICLILFFVLIDHDNQQVSDTNYISAAFMYAVLPTMALFFLQNSNKNDFSPSFQVSQLAVFLADTSHCAILLVSILAIFLGFLR